MGSYRILDEDFCYYCQKQFDTPAKLQRHVSRSHPGTYADVFIREAKETRKEAEKVWKELKEDD